MARSLETAWGPRLLQVPGLVPGTGLSSCWRSFGGEPDNDCNFAAPSLPRVGKAAPHQERPQGAGGNKVAVGDIHMRYSPAGTAVSGWDREILEPRDTWGRKRSWAMTHPDPDSLRTGQKVGLYEKPGTC